MVKNSSDPISRGFTYVTHLVLLLAVLGLPLLGAACRGTRFKDIFRFPPPLEIPTDYPRFSWLAAGGVGLILAALAVAWIVRPRVPVSELSLAVTPTKSRALSASPFPWWGAAAFSWTLCWWVVAWSRLSVFESIQRYTFFPLWIGFIIIANALVQQRTGRSLMMRSPKRWASLFGASALFWWIFEWLNRFVQNWHYLGVKDVGPVEYAVHATVCFSTVLPAVAAMAELLASFPSWIHFTETGPAWPWFEQRRTALAMLCGGVGALFLTGVYPQQFYPALWAAPLAIVLGESVWRKTKRRSLAHEIASGDWRRAATWMMAALICGFFWELWNWRSLAKWIYTVPGVERWRVFEMPLLGYAGYLPFGLECLLIIDRLGGLGDSQGIPLTRKTERVEPARSISP